MDLKAIHSVLAFYLDKEELYFSHEEIDNVLDRAQIQLFNELKPQYAVNQQVYDALLPFKKEATFAHGATAGGVVALPSDYLHLLVVETVVMENGTMFFPPVELLAEDEISYRKSSQLIPVTAKNPIGELIGRNLQVYPAQPLAGTIKYLRRPKAPRFDYTLEGRTVTYKPDTSQQMEWDDTSIEKIIFKALPLLGINVKDADVIGFSQAKEQ